MDQTINLRVAANAGDAKKTPTKKGAGPFETLRLVLEQGGPGFAQFALNNACNANCGFCNFARDSFPKDQWKFADRQGGLDAITTLYENGVRYLLFTGGEPTLHHDIIEFT